MHIPKNNIILKTQYFIIVSSCLRLFSSDAFFFTYVCSIRVNERVYVFWALRTYKVLRCNLTYWPRRSKKHSTGNKPLDPYFILEFSYWLRHRIIRYRMRAVTWQGSNLTKKIDLINPPFWIFFKNCRLLLHKMSWGELILPL